MKRRVRALIVDSGMRNRGGHNFSYTRAVEGALARRDVDVDVFASRHLDRLLCEATGYTPVFSLGSYDFPPGNGRLRDIAYVWAQSAVFAEELEAQFRSRDTSAYDFVFSHTLTDFELLAWRRVLRHRHFGHLFLLLRSTPGFRRGGRLRVLVHPYWRLRSHALSGIRRAQGDRFTLLTDSELLTEDYAVVYGGRIVTAPIPVSDLITMTGPRRSRLHDRYPLTANGRLRIGYLGDARSAKGFALLPSLVRAIAGRTDLKARFIIQCPPSASGTSGQEAKGLTELRALEDERDGRVTLISEYLSEEEYADLVRDLDIIVLPYRRSGYREPTSGIFAEALALGKPVVVTNGTWMAAQLYPFLAGLAFEDGNAADLARVLEQVIARYEEFTRRAQDFSDTWRKFHNADRLVDVLLDKSGVAAG